MSTQKYAIEIQARKGIKNERFFISNAECPGCSGKGVHTSYVPGKPDPETTPCTQCDATGRLKAGIVIKWEPDYN